MMLVLDASSLVEYLKGSDRGEQVARAVEDARGDVHLPAISSLEVTQVLRRLVRHGTVSDQRAAGAIEDLADFRAVRYPPEPFLERIWQLRHNLSAYDAAYVALAEALEAPLLTLDSRLAAAPGHAADVTTLG